MPRGARLYAPGTLHHVMARGIEGRRIIEDDKDREKFIFRNGELVLDSGTSMYARVLMDTDGQSCLFFVNKRKLGNVRIYAAAPFPMCFLFQQPILGTADYAKEFFV